VLQSGAKDLPVDRDRFLRHIAEHTARLTRIARALLTLARAQSGESVALQPVEIRALLGRVVAQADPAGEGRIAVACSTSLTALAQRELLLEALAALVDNALTHTEGEIRLDAREVGESVEIDVVDTGKGIAPEHHARIFEPFYRVAETGEGFGLGLAIAHQAVEAMDGELSVTPNTFTIRLPSS
jgi:signal transduction histidine kinase